MIDPSKPLVINNTTLTNVTASEIFTPLGNSDEWNYNTTLLQAGSGTWNNVSTIVQTNSASWEETADILPTVTNYLSTSNVQVSALSLSSVTFTNRFTIATTLTATTTVLEVLVNGTSKYLPLFDIN
jgi:arabinogalactan endo-1,4-beta-galactosidase